MNLMFLAVPAAAVAAAAMRHAKEILIINAIKKALHARAVCEAMPCQQLYACRR